jgi:hypothetical protein
MKHVPARTCTARELGLDLGEQTLNTKGAGALDNTVGTADVEAFPWGTAATYLVRDDDGAYGHSLGLRDILARTWPPEIDAKSENQFVGDIHEEPVPLSVHVCESLHGHE